MNSQLGDVKVFEARISELEKENLFLVSQLEKASHVQKIGEKLSLLHKKEDVANSFVENLVVHNSFAYAAYYRLESFILNLQGQYHIDDYVLTATNKIPYSKNIDEFLQSRNGYFNLMDNPQALEELIPCKEKFCDAYMVPVYIEEQLEGLVFVANNDFETSALKNHLECVTDLVSMFEQRLNHIEQVENLSAQIEAGTKELQDDIRKRESVQNWLAQKEQKLALHVQQTPLGVIEWNVRFEVTAWNPSAERIFGYSEEEAIGKHATELVLPSNMRDVVDVVWTELMLQKGGLRSTNENLSKDGSVVTCDWYNTPLVGEHDEVIGVASLVQDISSRIKYEKLLKREHDQTQMYLDTAQILLCALDIKGNIVMINHRGCQVLGYEKEEQLLGVNWFETFIVADQLEEISYIFEELMQGNIEGISEFENTMITKSGMARLFSFRNNYTRDEDGRINGVIFSAEDITENRQYENALISDKNRADSANQAKSTFLANMSHELRTPMHGILSFSQFGLSRIGSVPEEKLKEYFTQIFSSGHRLLSMLNDLLDLSKLESGKMKMELGRHDLHKIVLGCIAEQQARIEQLQITIDDKWDDSIGVIECDAARIGQVVTNLLSNAIKFSSENDTIHIKYEFDQLANNNGCVDAIRVSIVDHGPGVPEEYIESIFDKFVQSPKSNSKSGTGLGLAITREIILAHDGRIWAENVACGGAIFVFLIPISKLKSSDS